MIKSRRGKMIKALLLALATLILNFNGIALADDPGVNLAAPTANLGDLGAALGDVWNMDSTGDVVWTQPDSSNRTVEYTLENNVAGAYGQALRGEAPKGSDLASAFYADADLSLPGQVYRYLIYRAFIPPHQPNESGVQFTNGRILFSSEWGANWQGEPFENRRYSKPYAICGYGQWCVYYFDLTQNLNGPGSPNPWNWGQPGAAVKAFGLWPHENWATSGGNPSGDSPDYFYLDYAYLTGEIVASPTTGYNYTVRWLVSDADGGLLTSNLYYQEQNELLTPAQSPACNAANLNSNWTAIPGATSTISLAALPNRVFLPVILKPGQAQSSPFGSGVVGAYNQSFTWNLSSATYTEGKVYYVCAVVEDSDGNRSYGVSSAPVIKAPALTPVL